jgi:hypothetical protein
MLLINIIIKLSKRAALKILIKPMIFKIIKILLEKKKIILLMILMIYLSSLHKLMISKELFKILDFKYL